MLGIPSIAALLFAVWVWISLSSGPPETRYADTGSNGVIGLLQSAVYNFARTYEFFEGVSKWLSEILAMLALMATLVSVGLFVTGRGLHHQAPWARITGAVFAVALLLLSSGRLLSALRTGSVTGMALFGASVYTIWVLGWRFSER